MAKVATKSIWEQLEEPFPGEDLEWRVMRSSDYNGQIEATIVPYITARAIYDRLDKVLGPGGWDNEISITGEGGNTYVLQKLTIKEDGKPICVKMDGAEPTDIEAVKGGISGAIKRVAVLVGIGRYLYKTPWIKAVLCSRGNPDAQFGKTKSGANFWWLQPKTLEDVLSGEYHKRGDATPAPKAEEKKPKPADKGTVEKPNDEQMATILEARNTAEKCIIDGKYQTIKELRADFDEALNDTGLSAEQHLVSWAPVERAWWERELQLCGVDGVPGLILDFKKLANPKIVGVKYIDEFLARAKKLQQVKF